MVTIRRITWAALILGLIAAFFLGIGWGAVSIPPAQVAGILLHRMGIETNIEFTTQQNLVLWGIRLPRVLLGLLVGAALAVAGGVLQGIFRNPLAEPALLGITSGGVVGAGIAIMTGAAQLGVWATPLAAFLGALLTTLGLHRFARLYGKTDATYLVLGGVALNLFLGAIISLLTFISRAPGMRDMSFWTLGGLGSTQWSHIYLAAPVILIAALLLWRLGAQLNLMLLGETEAQNLGVDTNALRNQAIILIALIVGTAVAFSGSIAFVGLVVPHALRLVFGPDYRILIPASVLAGATLLAVGDLLARTIVSPMEVPIGILMTLVGGPLFFYLLHRTRKQGGWR